MDVQNQVKYILYILVVQLSWWESEKETLNLVNYMAVPHCDGEIVNLPNRL